MRAFDKDILFQFYTNEREYWGFNWKLSLASVVIVLLALLLNTTEGRQVVAKLENWANGYEWYKRVSEPKIQIEIKVTDLRYFIDKFSRPAIDEARGQVREQVKAEDTVLWIDSYVKNKVSTLQSDGVICPNGRVASRQRSETGGYMLTCY